MMAYQHTKNEAKGFLFSVLAHTVLIGGYFIFLHSQSLTVMSSSKMIVMEMATLERSIAPKHVPPAPLPPKEVKIEPIKPIEKPVEKPKPVIKKESVKPLPKQEVIEPIETTHEPIPSLLTPLESAPTRVQESVQVPAQSVQAEPFVKTDFEIIRDKVLSHLVYPSIAKRMNWNGVVHVALVIDSSGYLLNASIHQSSGRDILDNAALEAANKLKNQQLPKPQSTSTVILPIAFKLR